MATIRQMTCPEVPLVAKKIKDGDIEIINKKIWEKMNKVAYENDLIKMVIRANQKSFE
ncbi:MAG: hypothetical protein LVR00_06110 [Rhabdochlamydiaceae bacterium]